MKTESPGPHVRCPTCGDVVVWSTAAAWRPFCSERCRLLDLGAWFSEERAIPDAEPPSGADILEHHPGAGRE